MHRTHLALLTGLLAIYSIACVVLGARFFPAQTTAKNAHGYAVVRIVPMVVEAMSPEEQEQEEVILPTPDTTAEIDPLPHSTAYLPLLDSPNIHEEDKPMLDKTLRWLPQACRDNLVALVVQYDGEVQRGLATMSTIALRGGMSHEETVAVLVHECAHVIDLAGLKGTSDAGRSLFPDGSVPAFNDDPSIEFYQISWSDPKTMKVDAGDGDFASGYAKADPWEDLAETFVARALHRDALYARAEKSEKLMQKIRIVEQYYLPADFPTPPTRDPRSRQVWDWTKEEHSLIL